jgi:sulfatase modifying factor 1
MPSAALEPAHSLPAALEAGTPPGRHLTTQEELLGLVFPMPARTAAERHAEQGARAFVAPSPGRFNQGNQAVAKHTVDGQACLDGLRGVVLQTDEQRARCKGRDGMVPIYRGDVHTAAACIDIFEYPNRVCELPFVWGTPFQAEQLCRADGKRLCTEHEWNLACAGDPEAGADRTYAYGDKLDLDVCNTNKPHAFGADGQTWVCSPVTAEKAWSTCATETEPSGAFPQCRSRLGVYDLHGNVAEMMTRTGPSGEVLTQLKGSAFFYVDVAREPAAAQKPGGRETYPDQCAYDPRWHVEALSEAKHSNYHLGFRCCLGL